MKPTNKRDRSPSLNRLFDGDEPRRLDLLLRHDADPSLVADLIEATDEWAESLLSDGEDVGESDGSEPVPSGTLIRFVTAGQAGSWLWVDHLFDELDAHDIAATLAPDTRRRSKPPLWAVGGYFWSTSVMFWTFDHEAALAQEQAGLRSAHGWHLTEQANDVATRELTRWVMATDDQPVPYVMSDDWEEIVPATNESVQAAVMSKQANRSLPWLKAVRRDKSAARQASWQGPFGHSSVSALVPWPDPLWSEQTIGSLRKVIVDNAAHLSSAFVSHGALDQQVNLPGRVRSQSVARVAHLLDRYVPDVFGIQLLTSRHLDRVRHLDHWSVTSLGHDRHLVEWPDLSRWYRDPETPELPADRMIDPAVRAQAREDFRDLFLTPEVVAANPPLWRAPVLSEAPVVGPSPRPARRPTITGDK